MLNLLGCFSKSYVVLYINAPLLGETTPIPLPIPHTEERRRYQLVRYLIYTGEGRGNLCEPQLNIIYKISATLWTEKSGRRARVHVLYPGPNQLSMFAVSR